MPQSNRKYSYDQEYLKRNIKNVVIPFNRQNPEDVKLLEWLNSQREGKTAYVKRLFREDMKKGGK